jgi:hypothetical protein
VQPKAVVGGMKIFLSRSLPMNVLFPHGNFINRQCATKWEAVPEEKNWQQCRAVGSRGVSWLLDLDKTIFVLATLVKVKHVHSQ